jgi:ribosomal protein L7Ae-like RNA K-turn-binding protein
VDSAKAAKGLVVDKELVKLVLETKKCLVCFIPPCFGSKIFYQLCKKHNVPLIDTMTANVMGKLVGKDVCDAFAIFDFGKPADDTDFMEFYLEMYYNS